MTESAAQRRYRGEVEQAGEILARPDKLVALETALRQPQVSADVQRLHGIIQSRLGATEFAWLRFYYALQSEDVDEALLAHMLDNAERGGWHELARDLLRAIPRTAFEGSGWSARRLRLEVTGADGHPGQFCEPQDAFNPSSAPLLAGSFEERLPLQALAGWGYLDRVETVWVIGAHRFDEKAHFERLCPNVASIVLVEPHPETVVQCERLHRHDRRVRVFAVALSDRTATVDFHLSSNDGLSSSLMPFGEHQDFARTTHMTSRARVSAMTWSDFRREFSLPCPDVLVVDTQGAEHAILSGIPASDRRDIGIIYTEASTRPLYIGARTLEDVDELLRPTFACAGFFPIRGFDGVHGNALYLNRRFIGPGARAAGIGSDDNVMGSASACRTWLRTKALLGVFGRLREALLTERGRADGAGVLYLWGAGGAGRQIREFLRHLGFAPVAFVDRAPEKWGTIVDGLAVVSPDHLWSRLDSAGDSPERRPFIVVATSLREALLDEFARRNLQPDEDFFVPCL